MSQSESWIVVCVPEEYIGLGDAYVGTYPTEAEARDAAARLQSGNSGWRYHAALVLAEALVDRR